MIIGVYSGNWDSRVGGGYVYQKCILESLIQKQLSASSKHKIIFFHNNNDASLENNDDSVNIEWYKGKLNEAAIVHRVDIMWFVSIAYEDVDIPYIVPVWDLQHRLQPFFPEVSSCGESIVRDNTYSYYLPRASYILTGTEQGKKEISFFYKIPLERIIVNPLPLPQYISSDSVEITDELKMKDLLPNNFLFYPAQFWPHKNHIVLLEALKILKTKYSLNFKLVFTGFDHGNAGYIDQKVADLHLGEDVLQLGFVSIESMCWLYQNAFALVYPSFFGPDNIPPLEAFSVGCPVVAAAVDGAEEQLGDAAILINPRDENGFADAIARLKNDASLRNGLIQKGFSVIETRTAENYVNRVMETIEDFSLIRRCWGGAARIKYLPKMFDWLTTYLNSKEMFSMISLLRVCEDQQFEELYNNSLPLLNNIVLSNMKASLFIENFDYDNALTILNNVLVECVDYPPVYMNLSKISYARLDTKMALEYLKKAEYYSKILNSVSFSENFPEFSFKLDVC